MKEVLPPSKILVISGRDRYISVACLSLWPTDDYMDCSNCKNLPFTKRYRFVFFFFPG